MNQRTLNMNSEINESNSKSGKNEGVTVKISENKTTSFRRKLAS